MRFFLVLLLMVSSMSAHAAQPAKGSKESLESKSSAIFLRELTKRIEAAGYNNVHMIPQMFVVLANRSDGTLTALIVDSKTLKAVEVEGALEFIGDATGTRGGTPSQH
jgi:hypothetical protein